MKPNFLLRVFQLKNNMDSVIHHPNHGSVVWKFIDLDNKVQPKNLLEHAGFQAALWFQPVLHFLFWITWLLLPDVYAYFGGSYDISTFSFILYIVNTLNVIVGSVRRWFEVVEHYNLGTTIMGWRIVTNATMRTDYAIRSRDPRHRLFRYAAGARLLLDNLR